MVFPVIVRVIHPSQGREEPDQSEGYPESEDPTRQSLKPDCLHIILSKN